MADLGYFDAERSTITVEGWKRIEALRQSRPNSRQAFVAMWFDKSLDDAWLNGFKRGIEVVVVPAFDKGLTRHNRALARKSRAPGQAIVYVHVDRMVASRPQGLTLSVL